MRFSPLQAGDGQAKVSAIAVGGGQCRRSPFWRRAEGAAGTGRRRALAAMRAAAVTGGRRGRQGQASDGVGHRWVLAE
jgi:hypothetical protein